MQNSFAGMPIDTSLADLIAANLPDNTTGIISPLKTRQVATALGTEIDAAEGRVMAAFDSKADTSTVNAAIAANTAAIAALPTVGEMNAAIADAIADVPGSSIELSTPSTFAGSIKFDKLMRTATVNSSDISGPITVDATGAVDNGGYRLIITEDGGGEPALSADFVQTGSITYDTTDGNSTALVVTNIGGTYVYGWIRMGEAVVVPALDAPSFSADATSDTVIDLTSITYDSDSTGMLIERATNSGFTTGLATVYTGTPKSSHSDTGRTASTHYYYRISTTAPGFTDSPYAYDDDTTDAAGLTQLATPGSFTFTADSDTTATAAWGNISNESSFSVQIATNAGFTTGLQTVSKTANTLSHQFTGLTASTLYYSRVQGIGDGVTYSNSAYSTTASDTTDAPSAVTLNAPTSFAAGTPTPDGAPFTWTDTNSSPAESSYLIQITTAADTGYASVVVTRTPAANATSAAAGTGLTASTAYRARIKAVGNGTTTLDSAWSNEVTFTTAASIVQLATPSLTLTVDSSSAITADWTNVSNESGYSVQLATNSGFTTGLVTQSIAANTLTHQFTGLTASTLYYIRVKAVGDGVSFSDSAYDSDSETTDAPSLTQIYNHNFTALSPFTKVEQGSGTVSISSNLVELFTPSYPTDGARANHIAALGGLYTPGDILHIEVRGVALSSGGGIIGIGDVNVAYDWSQQLQAGTNTYIEDTTSWGTQGDIVFNINTNGLNYVYISGITVWKE